MTSATIDLAPLKPLSPRHRLDWRLWQLSNFNVHRGVVELWAPPGASIDELAHDVRFGVGLEFRPGWLRGFGFGALIHLATIPPDFSSICNHIDTRNRRGGVWQWAILCVDSERIVVGVHTWLHGRLRPAYESLIERLQRDGFECYSSDAQMDQLFVQLRRIALACRAFQIIAGVVT